MLLRKDPSLMARVDIIFYRSLVTSLRRDTRRKMMMMLFAIGCKGFSKAAMTKHLRITPLVVFILSVGVVNAQIPAIFLAGQSNMQGVSEQAGNNYASQTGQPGLSLQSLIPILTRRKGPRRRKVAALEAEIIKVDSAVADSTIASLETQELLSIQDEFPTVFDNIFEPMSSVYCSYQKFVHNNPGNSVPLVPALNLRPASDQSDPTRCGEPWGLELMLGQTIGLDEAILAKVATGGTNIYEAWSKEYEEATGQQNAWSANVVPRIQALDSSLHGRCQQPGSCAWAAAVYFQGENDSFDQVDADTYGGNLTRVISDLRTEMHNAGSLYMLKEEIPVVIVKLGAWRAASSLGRTVMAAQQAFVDEPSNNAAIVVTNEDLSSFYHFETAAQLIIGYRTARALESLGVGSGSPTNPPTSCSEKDGPCADANDCCSSRARCRRSMCSK